MRKIKNFNVQNVHIFSDVICAQQIFNVHIDFTH